MTTNFSLDGGEDEAEAMLDGINAALKMKWREKAQKLVVVLCDAPPHGSKFHPNTISDDFPEGCPCGLEETTILNEMKERKIKFSILGLEANDALDPMHKQFQEIYPELSFQNCAISEFGQKLFLTLDQFIQSSP
jgi:hypothetical protein